MYFSFSALVFNPLIGWQVSGTHTYLLRASLQLQLTSGACLVAASFLLHLFRRLPRLLLSPFSSSWGSFFVHFGGSPECYVMFSPTSTIFLYLLRRSPPSAFVTLLSILYAFFHQDTPPITITKRNTTLKIKTEYKNMHLLHVISNANWQQSHLQSFGNSNCMASFTKSSIFSCILSLFWARKFNVAITRSKAKKVQCSSIC